MGVSEFPKVPTVRVAVIGAGAMARAHIAAFQSLPAVEVVGIHSRSPTRAADLAKTTGIAGVYDSVAGLHAGTAADLVVIAVSIPAVHEVAVAALAHPWLVLLEKPPGIDLTAAEALAATASEAGARVRVAFNRRHFASTRAVAADLASDPSPRFIHVQDQQSQAEARAWGYPEPVVERFMFANSIHLIDYLVLFGRGKIVNVKTILPWSQHAAVVVAHIAFSSGDQGLYEGIWDGPGPWSCAVTTRRRRWELRPLETARYQDRGQRTMTVLEADELDQSLKPGLGRQAAAAVAVCRGEPATGLPDLPEALKTMRLIARIFAPGRDP